MKKLLSLLIVLTILMSSMSVVFADEYENISIGEYSIDEFDKMYFREYWNNLEDKGASEAYINDAIKRREKNIYNVEYNTAFNEIDNIILIEHDGINTRDKYHDYDKYRKGILDEHKNMTMGDYIAQSVFSNEVNYIMTPYTEIQREMRILYIEMSDYSVLNNMSIVDLSSILKTSSDYMTTLENCLGEPVRFFKHRDSQMTDYNSSEYFAKALYYKELLRASLDETSAKVNRDKNDGFKMSTDIVKVAENTWVYISKLESEDY